MAEIDKEINESGASMANLRENIRVRKLVRAIEATQTEIDSFDMEEAAKARRTFKEKYDDEKERENEMHTKVTCASFVPMVSFHPYFHLFSSHTLEAN